MKECMLGTYLVHTQVVEPHQVHYPKPGVMRPMEVQGWKVWKSGIAVAEAGNVRFAVTLMMRTWLLRHSHLLGSTRGKL